MLGVVGSNVCLPTSLRPFERGARDGAVVRAHASHQCGPGSNPGVDAIMWVEFAPRGFSAGIPLFPFPQKPTSPNSNSNRNQVDGEPLCGCATYKSLFIYFIEVFIYFNISWPSSFIDFQFVMFFFSTPTQRCTLNYCTSPACLTTTLPWKIQEQLSILSEYESKTLFTHGACIK